MSEASFYHAIKQNSFQKLQVKSVSEPASLVFELAAAVLSTDDQRQGKRHAAFDFAQELHFPVQAAADSAQLATETQLLLQVLQSLLAAEERPAPALEQLGQDMIRLGRRLRQRLQDSTRQLETQTKQALQAPPAPVASAFVLELQAAVQAAAAQVELTLTRAAGPLTVGQLAERQAGIQALQQALFQPLRGLQGAHQALAQSQAELDQMQGRWVALNGEHGRLIALLQEVKAGLQQLGEDPEISADLRQNLHAELKSLAPVFQAAGRAQNRSEAALAHLLAVLKELNQTAAIWQQLILDSLKLSQTLKHWHQELACRQQNTLSERFDAVGQTDRALAPAPESLSLLSLLAAWQTIFGETRLIYQALQAEINTQAQIERDRLQAYAEQMRAATRWHQAFLERLDRHRMASGQSVA